MGKNIFKVMLISAVSCAVALFWVLSSPSPSMREWKSKSYAAGGSIVKGKLTTFRLHAPRSERAIVPADEFKYHLQLDPEGDANAIKFLDAQAASHPEIWFFNRDGQAVATPITLKLVPSGVEHPTYTAQGSQPYPKELRRAADWTIEWAK